MKIALLLLLVAAFASGSYTHTHTHTLSLSLSFFRSNFQRIYSLASLKEFEWQLSGNSGWNTADWHEIRAKSKLKFKI